MGPIAQAEEACAQLARVELGNLQCHGDARLVRDAVPDTIWPGRLVFAGRPERCGFSLQPTGRWSLDFSLAAKSVSQVPMSDTAR
jgi:hypothetical protein